MSTPNKMRGESEIVLDGKTFKLKASVESLMAIEERVGLDLLSILSGISTIRIPFKTICILFDEFQRAGAANPEDALKFKQCCELLLKVGYMRHSAPILNVLGDAVMAGNDDVLSGPEAGNPS